VGKKYVEAALNSDGTVHTVVADKSGHFEMIDPDSSTWPQVLEAAKQALEME
jgi:hypothetical protein